MNDFTQPGTNVYPLHTLVIGLHDRPGAVHSVSDVFSGRGLQMEAFHGTSDSLSPDGHASALILFYASPDRANLVTRVIRRLSCVRSAELLATDDQRLIQSVLIERTNITLPDGIRIIPVNQKTALALGSPAAMQHWLASGNVPPRLGATRLDYICNQNFATP